MKYEFFGILDLISFFGWLIIFIAGAHIIRAKNTSNPDFKFYIIHFYWKVLMSISFALIYILVYDGGDTTAYWQGALKLNQVCYNSPSDYLTEIFKGEKSWPPPSYFNNQIGRPPRWIYSEDNSWFVCKIASIFSFFTLGSFLTLNLFFGVISSWIAWRFFRFMNRITNIQTIYLALAFLFIPTVGFWCSGLSKDTIVLCGIYGCVSGFFYFLHRDNTNLLIKTIQFSVFTYVIFATRPFVLICVFIPISLILIFQLNKNKPFITRFFTRIIGVGVTIGLFGLYISNSGALGEFSSDKIVQTAEIIQTDFQTNETYTGKKYDLGIDDFSSNSLISVIPMAIATTLFRPFIWEANSVLMMLNGLESLVLIYFFSKIIWTGRKDNSLKVLFQKDYFIFSIFYVLILAYFVGFTSGLFGILARLKAPVLPFFVLIIVYKMTKANTALQTIEEDQEVKK